MTEEGAYVSESWERDGKRTHCAGLPALAVVEHHPVVHAILGLARIFKNLGEELSQEVVVGRLLEAELANIVEVDGELFCRSTPLSARVPARCRKERTYLGSPRPAL